MTPARSARSADKVVEADETFVGGKAREPEEQGPAKTPVLSLVERDGRVRSFHVPNVTAQTLKPIIVSHVNKATYLMTDDAPSIGRSAPSSPDTARSTTAPRNMSAPSSGIPTRLKTTFRSSSAGSTAAISTSARRIFIGTRPSLISATTTGSRSASMTRAHRPRDYRRQGQAADLSNNWSGNERLNTARLRYHI